MRKNIVIIVFIFFNSTFFPGVSFAQWTQMNSPARGNIYSLLSYDSDVFAGSYGGGIFRTTNNGYNWFSCNNGLSFSNSCVTSIIYYGGNLFAGINSYGIFKTSNKGLNWQPVNNGLTNLYVNTLFVKGSSIYAGTNSGIFISSNSGSNWSFLGIPGGPIISISVKDSIFFAGTNGFGVYRSTNSGLTWQVMNSGLGGTYIYAIEPFGNKLFAGTQNGPYYTTNYGINWYTSGYFTPNTTGFKTMGVELFATTMYGMFKTTNHGDNWITANYGITNNWLHSICLNDSTMFAGSEYGIFKSTNRGSNWVLSNDGVADEFSISFTSFDTNIYMGSEGFGVYRLNNYNGKWVKSGTINVGIFALAVCGQNLFAGSVTDGIYRSTDRGTSWQLKNSGLPNLSVKSFAVKDSSVYAGTSTGIFLSTNFGNNWIARNNGMTYSSVWSIVVSDSFLFAGVRDGSGGIYRSSNNGQSWENISSGLTNMNIRSIIIDGNKLYAGTHGGVFISSNNGNSWTSIGLINNTVYSLFKYGTFLIAATNGGIYTISETSKKWVQKNDGFISIPTTYALFLKDSYIYCGTLCQSVWKRQINNFVSVNNANEILPVTYMLFQNYPNPFNPTTNIRYQVANNSFVSMKMYDALGRNLETLVNEKQTAGTYEASWDASKYPSGIYFYKLEAGDFSQVKKMILVK